MLLNLKDVMRVRDRETGEDIPFSLSRPRDRATLCITYHDDHLRPHREYVLEVESTTKVRDGFGQPLRSSNTVFLTSKEPNSFLQPTGSMQFASPLSYPFAWGVLARGDGNERSTGNVSVMGTRERERERERRRRRRRRRSFTDNQITNERLPFFLLLPLFLLLPPPLLPPSFLSHDLVEKSSKISSSPISLVYFSRKLFSRSCPASLE